MLRILLVLVFAWACTEVSAQGVQEGVKVGKSAEVVVIRGKSYYLHSVQPGQTLYSICKAYDIGVEELKKLNDKQDNNLALYEVLKVPYKEEGMAGGAAGKEKEFVEMDGKYYYHRAAKGETLYSIARHYGVKPKRLLRQNSAYAGGQALAVGDVVRVPLKDIDPAILARQQQAAEDAARRQAEGDGGTEGAASGSGMAEGKPVRGGTDTLPAGGDGGEGLPATGADGGAAPDGRSVRVALLLPFGAGEYPAYHDTLAGVLPVQVSARSEQFVSFYEGVLLAADSLKKMGYRVDLHVYDTERRGEKMYALAGELNALRPDLIIGPVYASVYKVLAENLDDRQVPMVYPLSSRGGRFDTLPNFVQVNASFGTLVEEMAGWLEGQCRHANLVYIRTGNEGADAAERAVLEERLGGIGGLRAFDWSSGQAALDSLRTFLLPEGENILVMPTAKEADVSKILPLLSALADEYRVSVVGMPEWQTFASVDHETYYKLDTRLFTYSYVDYASEGAGRLAETYRKYFYTEPSTLVFKAFDMGMYFMEMAAKHGRQTLDALKISGQKRDFSVFRFAPLPGGSGLENRAFYMVHFASDYRILCR